MSVCHRPDDPPLCPHPTDRRARPTCTNVGVPCSPHNGGAILSPQAASAALSTDHSPTPRLFLLSYISRACSQQAWRAAVQSLASRPLSVEPAQGPRLPTPRPCCASAHRRAVPDCPPPRVLTVAIVPAAAVARAVPGLSFVPPVQSGGASCCIRDADVTTHSASCRSCAGAASVARARSARVGGRVGGCTRCSVARAVPGFSFSCPFQSGGPSAGRQHADGQARAASCRSRAVGAIVARASSACVDGHVG